MQHRRISRSSKARPKIGRLRALARYYRDPSASLVGKLVAFAALAYVIMPVDFIPDVPFVGWLDDIGVMGLATAWLTRVVARYREQRELGPDSEALPQSELGSYERYENEGFVVNRGRF